MPALDPTVLRWLRAHHDSASLDELLSLGLTTDQVRRLVRLRILEPRHRAVYLLAGSPGGLLTAARAACAANPEFVVSGVSAGRLWGLRRLPADDRLHVLAPPRTAAPARADVVLHRTRSLPREDSVRRPDGIRLTAPPRTVFDLAAVLDRGALESVVEQVLDRHCSMATLWRTAHRLAARGRPGTAAFVRLLRERPEWQNPADSDLELRVMRALEARGIVLVRQFRLETAIGVIHLDGGDPGVGWGVEVDHITWHGGRLDAQYDKVRDRAARRVGWQIERVTDLELRDRFDATIDELVELHARRTAQRRQGAG